MGNRPEVQTASLPVLAVDTFGLAQQMVAALARLPFRHPTRGVSTLPSNLATSLTREVLRSFMGYASSLPLPEFRSIELMLDEACKVVMPPIVRRFDVHTAVTEIGGVPGILLRPRHGQLQGVILYMHGGGYIGTSPTMYSFFTARLCRETGCAVFVADYRLAPEFPYPAAVDDAVAVLSALEENHGIPRERLLVAGDSGGGGVVNSLILETPEHDGLTRPAGVILFSPEVDLRLDEPSVTENAERDILPWNIPTTAYLHGLDPASEYVSAVDGDLSGFPPTCMSWGGDEMFRDPIRRFADHLQAAGVPLHAHEAPGMFHVFQILMPWAEISQESYSHVAQFTAKVLATAPQIDHDPFGEL